MNTGDDRSDFDAGMEEMNTSGDVEVGESNLASEKGKEPEEPTKKPLTGAAKAAREAKEAREAAAAANVGEDDGNQGDDEGEEGEEGDEGGEGEEQPKRKTPSQRIQELTRRNREYERRLERMEAEIAAAKNPSGQEPQQQDKYAAIGKAPDPNDQTKYPLGHLDEKYVEDAIDYRVKKAAIDQADAALQRQQEQRQQTAQEQQQQRFQDQITDLTAKGVELFEDFEDEVVKTGMKGEWDLSQPTFEACAEADNGAAILHALSQDKAEATRVAKLSPYQQALYVSQKDAEISAKTKPRTKPQAGDPPKTRTNGANSSHRINPATDNLDDFEKAWAQDEKAHGH